jgi:peroxiredoxin
MQGKPYTRRLHELEERFAALAPRIPDGAQREGFSILHGMIQELWRDLRPGGAASANELTIQDVADLYKTAPKMEAENQPLPVGTPAADFTLPDANGQPVALRDYRGRPVVLVFYPLDWSPACSDQLSLYQAERDEFAKYGAQLLAVSVDSLYSHGAWAAVRGLTFPLLADFHPKGEVARRYRVWRERDGFSERALFVVDAEGVIRYAHVSPQLHHIPDIYELYRALDALREGRGSEPARTGSGVSVAAGAGR